MSVCRLKILCRGWFWEKHLSTIPRNFFPRFVITFASHGGLYHVMFLFRFFLFLVVWFTSVLYVSLKLYPLSSIAFW